MSDEMDLARLPEDLLADLDKKQLTRLIIDMFHRIVVHHGLWFAEAERQMGMNMALAVVDRVFRQSFEIQINRLGKRLGFGVEDGLPEPLLRLSHETLLSMLDDVAKNWLANDGVWFQSVELSRGMFDAKRTNDSCWVRFSPFEAQSIKTFLDLPDNPGLPGLKKALGFRLYARLNKQSISEEGPHSLVFEMNECRVQTARKRRGLDDYPCKSAGMVEYPYFARSIDSRIETECVACPPDDHPEEWSCAWRFSIPEESGG
jgi:hypothetical protein